MKRNNKRREAGDYSCLTTEERNQGRTGLVDQAIKSGGLLFFHTKPFGERFWIDVAYRKDVWDDKRFEKGFHLEEEVDLIN